MASPRIDEVKPARIIEAVTARHHYSVADLQSAITACGISAGDTVVAYVGMGLIGYPDLGSSEDAMFEAVLDAYRLAVGPQGTLLVPTYTYSFGAGETFDVRSTPSAIGPFSERFRNLAGVARSVEPMLSVAGIGPAALELLSDLPPDSYGPGSIFERLLDVQAWLCNVGVGFRYSTHLHYVEQRVGVPYRFLKVFPGRIVDADGERSVRWTYGVRILQESCDPDFTRLEERAERTGALRRSPVGIGEVVGIRMRDFDELCEEGVRENRWFLARGPESDAAELVRAEGQRVGEPTLAIKTRPRSLLETVSVMASEPAYPVGAGCDFALDVLTADLPHRRYAYPSGTPVGDSVIPERWTLEKLLLEALDDRAWLGRNLFRVPYYCRPFAGEVDAAALADRCTVSSDRDSIPLTSRLYEPDWGLSCSARTRDQLPSGQLSVEIDTKLSYGMLRAAEVIVPGKSERGVVVLAYLDHHGLANDSLSASVVACEAFRRLLASPGSFELTYRLILSPRGFGPLAVFSERQDVLPDVVGILQLESLGINAPFVLQTVGSQGTPFVAACERALTHANGDVRRAMGPGPWLARDDVLARDVLAPIACLARCQRPLDEHPYDGFRTTVEDPSFVSDVALEASVEVVADLLRSFDGTV